MPSLAVLDDEPGNQATFILHELDPALLELDLSPTNLARVNQRSAVQRSRRAAGAGGLDAVVDNQEWEGESEVFIWVCEVLFARSRSTIIRLEFTIDTLAYFTKNVARGIEFKDREFEMGPKTISTSNLARLVQRFRAIL
jgi:hypothetical protein